MINITTVDKAVELKRAMDAAYLVFKKSPTVEASAQWTAATRAYKEYCVKTITNLVDERIAEVTFREDIIKNFDKYHKCKVCGAELLYKTSDTDYIASSDFIEDFPGWCYPHLLEHCMNTECESCTVNTKPICPFAEVKKLTAQGDE